MKKRGRTDNQGSNRIGRGDPPRGCQTDPRPRGSLLSRGIRRTLLRTIALVPLFSLGGCTQPTAIEECVPGTGIEVVCGFSKPEDLAAVLMEWLGDSGIRARVGDAGRQVVKANRGALDRTLHLVARVLAGSEE